MKSVAAAVGRLAGTLADRMGQPAGAAPSAAGAGEDTPAGSSSVRGEGLEDSVTRLDRDVGQYWEDTVSKLDRDVPGGDVSRRVGHVYAGLNRRPHLPSCLF